MLIRKTQSGISLLEVLLSLSIIAIILVMATRYFFVASDNDHVNVTREQIGAVVAAVHSWKGQNPVYSSELTISTLYKDGFLPRSHSMIIRGDSVTLYNPWGKSISLNVRDSAVEIRTQVPEDKFCRSLLNSYPQGQCQSGSSSAAAFSLVIE